MTTADRYLRFAEREARGRSSVYEEWARGVAADDAVLTRLAELPEQKRQPALLFAAARLAGAAVGDWAAFRPWLIAHWDDVAAEMRGRGMQTNDPGRCAALLPLLGLVPGPLALIEVGASAGLALQPDRYAYRYRGEDGRVVALGAAPLVLECDTTGSPPIPAAPPDIRWRLGIDLDPLAVDNPDDVRRLETLAWPGQDERLARFRAAIRIARPQPPPIVAGDAVDDLAAAVSRVPPGLTPVVVSSGTLVYLPGLRRGRFRDLVRELGCRFIAMEPVGTFPDLVPAGLPAVPWAVPALLTLDEQPMAVAAPHGEALAWLAGPAPSAHAEQADVRLLDLDVLAAGGPERLGDRDE